VSTANVSDRSDSGSEVTFADGERCFVRLENRIRADEEQRRKWEGMMIARFDGTSWTVTHSLLILIVSINPISGKGSTPLTLLSTASSLSYSLDRSAYK
jgi:hypothetical protein